MNISVESPTPCSRRLQVEYTTEEVQKEYDESLSVYARHGRVKGFRQGRAPVDQIRRQYDKQILEGLHDRLLAKGYREAVKEHGITPITESDLKQSELKAGQPFSFSVTLEVEPQFDLPDYRGLEVEAREVAIDDAAVSQALERYLAHRGKYEDAPEDAVVQEGDMAAVDYTATVDGRPMAEVSEKAVGLAEGKDFWVIANEEYSFLPAFGPQLVGLKVGDSKEIPVAFDEKAPIEELRGRTGIFAATVKKIRTRKPAPMDDELFKSLNVKDEAELRESFRSMLKREADAQESSRRNQQLIQQLLGRATLDVPESEIRGESHRIVYEMVEDNTRRGVPEQEIRDHIGQISESAQAAARDRLKLRYLLKSIAKQEHIVVNDSEVSALLTAQALRSGAKSVKEFLQRAKVKEPDFREGLRQDLLARKTLELIMSQAKTTGAAAPAPEPSQEVP